MGVPRNHGIVGDGVWVRQSVEHLAGVTEIRAFDVHVDEAVGNEDGWGKTGSDHAGVGSLAGGWVMVDGAMLKDMREGCCLSWLRGGGGGEWRDEEFGGKRYWLCGGEF